MKPEGSLEPFRAAIKSVQRLLRRHKDRGAIIGGIAVAFLQRLDRLGKTARMINDFAT